MINIINIYSSFYFPIANKWFIGRGVYNVLGIFQTSFPFFIQNFLIIRAYLMKKTQQEIVNDLKFEFNLKTKKCEKNFLFCVIFIVIVRFLKYSLTSNISYLIFNTQSAFPELIFSCNDLMFVFYLELITESLENLSRKVIAIKSNNQLKIMQRKICKIFQIKRKIVHRYSVDLLVTITFNFILTIISFYWLIMRLIFNHLSLTEAIVTFSHFFVPCFILWILCRRCENFYKMVS